MATRKKIRPGELGLSDDLTALEVHYESIEFGTLPSGREVAQATKHGVKRIKFELPADGDLQQLAQQIVADCKLLHTQRVGEVEQLLAVAKERAQAAPAFQDSDTHQQQQTASPVLGPNARHNRYSIVSRQVLREEQQRYLSVAAASATQALAAAARTARVQDLEEYLEALYEEDLHTKTAAAAAIAQLFRDPRNLGPLSAHPTMLQALARLLREDAKKGSELCISLLMAFLALSHLPQAHQLLIQNQVGSLTMELLDLELRRTEHWQQRDGVAVADVGAKLLAGEPLSEREQRLALALARQEPLLYAGLSLLLNMAEDVAVEQKMVKKGLLSLLVVLLDRGSAQLLVLVTTFLRKLSLFAENNTALRESEVVARLAVLLPQPGKAATAPGEQQLLFSVLRLLHNLSFDEVMRQQMVAAGLIAKAVALLTPEGPYQGSISSSAGRDSADQATGINRDQGHMAAQGQADLGGTELRQLALGLLYHLSLQHKHRSMFLYTDAIHILHSMLAQAQPHLATGCPELAALMISLAGSCRVAEEMARGGRLEQLLEMTVGPAEPGLPPSSQQAADSEPASTLREPAEASQASAPQHVVQQATCAGADTVAAAMPAHAAPPAGQFAEDELLWKLLRALAEHDSEPLRARFAPALHCMARLLMGGTLPPAVFPEALGCFSSLEIPGYNYAHLLASTGLPAFLAELATSGTGRADQRETVLAVVHALGVLCADEACAVMLADAGLVDALHTLMLSSYGLEHEREEDFLLATTAAAARLMAQGPTRTALLAHAELLAQFAELLQHPSREVSQAADAALEAVAAASEEWAASVQRLKFEAHNREWLQIICQEELPAVAATAG